MQYIGENNVRSVFDLYRLDLLKTRLLFFWNLRHIFENEKHVWNLLQKVTSMLKPLGDKLSIYAKIWEGGKY